jgi:Membrane transport protein MerF
MTEKGLLRIGICGTAVAALCYFTPVLVVLLGAVGLSAVIGQLDYFLLPAVVFVSRPDGLRALEEMISMIELQSTITCPHCGHQQTETMPTDSCLFFYDCKGCAELLKPKQGDCCVFCSYGTVPCPPVQELKEKGEQSACCQL